MPAALSKQENVSSEEEQRQLALKRDRMKRNICISSFLSLCQHIICVQTEPRLAVDICNGDQGAAARLLGNTSGIVGLLSLLLNQVGGKMSDSLGRKPGFLVGPVLNILLGFLVFKRTSSRATVMICRVLRLIATTFSNTVMVDAALADICSQGRELEEAKAKVQLATGLAMLGTPFLEARLLQSGTRYVYLALSGLGAIHATFSSLFLAETLQVKDRSAGKLDLAASNPLSFVRIFTEGSTALWQLTVLTTFQMFLEGKNVSDIAQSWVRDHLKWSVPGIRNFVIIYGILCTAASAKMAPFLRTKFNAKDFTTLTNLLNAFAFAVRGLKASTALWLTSLVPMLPGVNGTCAIPLKAQATKLAAEQGFGKGEFSAWSNNMRALVGSAAPMLYGQVYSATSSRGMNPGLTFAFAGAVGAVVPQIMLWSMKDSDLGVEPAAKK